MRPLLAQERGFLYVHTPIVTASDCEGAGEMFQVTTLLSKIDEEPEEQPPTPEELDALRQQVRTWAARCGLEPRARVGSGARP